MTVNLFVYGTLKQGLPNHDRMVGRRVGGTWRTVQAMPLYVVRLPLEDRAPWLVNQPGQGHRVQGEVYEVDDALLPAMDRFEEVGLPTGYERVPIVLEPVDHAGPRLQAQAYLKPPSHLAQCVSVEGPFAEYTPELASGYWLELPADHPVASP
jgi:gamma-glutamylaminecyclotransferase